MAVSTTGRSPGSRPSRLPAGPSPTSGRGRPRGATTSSPWTPWPRRACPRPRPGTPASGDRSTRPSWGSGTNEERPVRDPRAVIPTRMAQSGLNTCTSRDPVSPRPVLAGRNSCSAGHDSLRACLVRALARWSDRPKQDFREVILDGDCRSDRRYLEISASSYAERITELAIRNHHLYQCIDYHNALCPGARRYAKPKNFQIGIAHSWSWAIGSSTRAARDRSMGS